jgi:glucose-6-phosphate dehydrogenase assembly protein OpcA
MKTPVYAYIPTSPAKITAALSDVFTDLRSNDQEFSRSANTNVIIAVSSRALLGDVETAIDGLSLVHPSRFFVVFCDDTLEDIATEISARCHGLSKSAHVCSEVVRIGAPAAKLPMVPSIVRGHFMTGTATELYLFDRGVSRELLDRLVPLADAIVFDSSDFSERVDIVAEAARWCSSLVDVQWIGLGPWREEIKTAFASPVVRELLSGLSEISIRAAGGTREPPPFVALLLAGWIVERLGLTHVIGRHGTLRGHLPLAGNREVRIVFDSRPAGEARLEEVRFQATLANGSAGSVRLVHGAGGLETIVEASRSFRSLRPLEDESRDALLRRFFLIGESTTNYNAALRAALHIRQAE